MKRDSILFYRSFYDAVKALPKKHQLAAFESIIEYGLNGVEPEGEGVISAIFALIKPQVDANNRRFINGTKGAEHGVKGGRPRKEQEQKPKPSKPNKTKQGVSLEFIKDENFKKVVSVWLEYKKSIGSSYKTQASTEAMARKLWSMANGNIQAAMAIVEQSIANNWKGLFELKEKQNNGQEFDFTGIAQVSGSLEI
jgi:hypothetical protein